MSDQPFLVDREGQTAILTINRHAQRNSLSFEMWEAFPGYIKELNADPAVRVIVLTGAGGSRRTLTRPCKSGRIAAVVRRLRSGIC